MRRKRQLRIGILMSFLLLTGCFRFHSERDFYEKHEQAATIENEQVNDNSMLDQLEKEEQALYKQILTEGKENNEQVRALIEEAKEKVTASRELVRKQKEVVAKAYESLQKTDKLLTSMKDAGQKEVGTTMSRLYEERYKAFEQVTTNHEKALALEDELYVLLGESGTSMKNINGKVSELNNVYVQMNKEVDVFNEATEKYNKEKELFYQLIHTE